MTSSKRDVTEIVNEAQTEISACRASRSELRICRERVDRMQGRRGQGAI